MKLYHSVTGADDDDVVIKAFATFDNGSGKMDGNR